MDKKRVLAAIFHDPPEKPFHIMASGKSEGHEEHTYIHYFSKLSLPPDISKESDYAASFIDRLPFKFARDIDTNKPMYFVHPLSGNRILLYHESQINTVYKDYVREGVFSQRILKDIKPEDSDDIKLLKVFWRLITPFVDKMKNVDTRIENTLLPADSRMPYHTIVDHLLLAGAIEAVDGLENASLLVFNIRGVQDFIRGAIKTKDLWAGSMIVSMLMLRAIHVIIELYGPQNVIYPSLQMNGLFATYLKDRKIDIDDTILGESTDKWFDTDLPIPSLPNKIVVMVKTSDAKAVLSKMVEAVNDKWLSLVEEAYGYFSGGRYERAEKEDWLKQASQFPIIAAVYMPYNEDKARKFITAGRYKVYSDIRNQIASLKGDEKVYHTFFKHALYPFVSESLDAKLNMRKTYQPPTPYEGIKGFSNRPHIEKSDSGSGLEAVVRRVREKTAGRVFSEERLDVIDAVKRLVADKLYDVVVPSVSEIAAIDILLDQANSQKLDKIVQMVSGSSARESYGYPEYRNYLKKRNYSNEVKSKVAYLGLTQALWNPEEYDLTPSDIKEVVGYSIDKLNRKVAILLMDGDKMGAWVGMKFKEIAEIKGIDNKLLDTFKNIENWIHPDFVGSIKGLDSVKGKLGDNVIYLLAGTWYQKSISSALAWFSVLVPFVVKKYEGFLVYAGGDDVMAIVPPSAAFSVANDIRKLYSGEYGELTLGDIKLYIKEGFIFLKEYVDSAGGRKEILTPIGFLPGRYMTMSTGVYIANFKHPLRLMVDGARKAEKMAKDTGRNRIYAIALQRSGSELRMGASYDRVMDMKDFYYTYMKRTQDSEATISPKFIYDFEHHHQGEDIVWEDVGTDVAMKKEETAREFVKYILKRRIDDKKNKDKAFIDTLFNEVYGKNVKEFSENIEVLRMIRYLDTKGGDEK